MGSNYGLDRDFSSGRVKVRMGFVSDLEVATGGFMDTGDRRGKESSSVKDGSKVSGPGRRSESRRAPTEPKAWGVLYLFSVIVNNTGCGGGGGGGCFVVIPKRGEFIEPEGVMGCGEPQRDLGMSHEELLICTEFEYFI